MRDTGIYCDHCGKVLSDMDDFIDSEIMYPLSIYYVETDLCRGCMENLRKILMDFIGVDADTGKRI